MFPAPNANSNVSDTACGSARRPPRLRREGPSDGASLLTVTLFSSTASNFETLAWTAPSTAAGSSTLGASSKETEDETVANAASEGGAGPGGGTGMVKLVEVPVPVSVASDSVVALVCVEVSVDLVVVPLVADLVADVTVRVAVEVAVSVRVAEEVAEAVVSVAVRDVVDDPVLLVVVSDTAVSLVRDSVEVVLESVALVVESVRVVDERVVVVMSHSLQPSPASEKSDVQSMSVVGVTPSGPFESPLYH